MSPFLHPLAVKEHKSLSSAPPSKYFADQPATAKSEEERSRQERSVPAREVLLCTFGSIQTVLGLESRHMGSAHGSLLLWELVCTWAKLSELLVWIGLVLIESINQLVGVAPCRCPFCWPKQAAGMELAGQAGVGRRPQGGDLYRGCSLKSRVCAGGAAHGWAANAGRGCQNKALVSLMTGPGASREGGDPGWVPWRIPSK